MRTTFDKLLGQLLLHSHSGDDVTSQVGDADTVDGQHAADFASAILINTRANVLATDPATAKIAFAADCNRLYLSDGTSWYGSPIPFGEPSTGVDIGIIPFEDDKGYSEDHINGKTLHNIAVGGYDTAQGVVGEGAIKYEALALQAYVNAAWRNIVTMTTAELDAVMLWTDNWDGYDLYGRNIIHGHKVDIGIFSSDHLVDGGAIADQL